MESRQTEHLMVAFILIILLSTGIAVTQEELNFCGTWRHDDGSLTLNLNLSTGCDKISISADKNSLSIHGQITSVCSQSKVMHLDQTGSEESYFCLYWEPLQDHLRLLFEGKDIHLCQPQDLQSSCCTDLSNGPKASEATFGILNGSVMNDVISEKTHAAYTFNGTPIACKALQGEVINKMNQGSARVTVTKDEKMGSTVEVEMEKDFKGFNITPDITGLSAETMTTVQIPSALKEAAQSTKKVVCTFHVNNSKFQEGSAKGSILKVVEITVGNDVIKNLPDPIKISFHHEDIPKTHSRKCVSWDTKEGSSKVNWVVDGCETHKNGTDHTECLCSHLTYFTVLVELEPRPVRHLLALTAITYVGCALSVISCIAIIIFLCRKNKRSKELSVPIHLGLAISLALLNLLFFFTGVLANVEWESVCTWVGAGLHYALLSSFSWMGIEIFHTFWLVYVVFSPSPKPFVWNLVGFALPAVPVGILIAVGDIYGVREVQSVEDSDPYRMCWMKSNHQALLAHYCTNITILVILVSSGFGMLFLVFRKIRARDEWRQNRVAFLSIWGLSCLFGTMWGLTFLDFSKLSVLSDLIRFLACFFTSFQGFLLMLRFCMLDWIRKQAGGSALGSTSSGSTRQHMLQAQEKN
ncbi:adhesion G-protein coupled receptor G5-like [Notolabrus celidotus]|uniref:adhesion G-protein coupled receptor G5-like n=1 Tax=Notolabrus celidotus TaxID=1203425 RepID=UPI00148FED05|nr:adhesion G-protein coupled receptor G5-like [Notolabrus celidotus]